jgi:hypothetical protein
MLVTVFENGQRMVRLECCYKYQKISYCLPRFYTNYNANLCTAKQKRDIHQSGDATVEQLIS